MPLKKNDCHVSNVPYIVGVCVVLHNMCEIYGDYCLHEWIINNPSPPAPSTVPATVPLSSTATSVRNAIKDFL
jgi:hypothetical protein